MKNIKLNKTILFTLVGGVIPLAFVRIIKANQLKFIGSNMILGLALALLIIICAYTVGYRFTVLNKKEKLANIILGTILYTIIFICFNIFIIKPVDYKMFDLILTGYYGVIASIIAIYTRSDANVGEQKQK